MNEPYYRGEWDVGIDEDSLSQIDRLGLACCRLNEFRWDDLLGPKPDGFDELPNFDPKEGRLFHRKIRTKADYTHKPYCAILHIIGSTNESRCYWKFVLGRTEAEWFQWYIHH